MRCSGFLRFPGRGYERMLVAWWWTEDERWIGGRRWTKDDISAAIIVLSVGESWSQKEIVTNAAITLSEIMAFCILLSLERSLTWQ